MEWSSLCGRQEQRGVAQTKSDKDFLPRYENESPNRICAQDPSAGLS